jgi:cell division protein FtsA
MGNMNYIAAIELSSSKVSGTVGVEAYDGIKILATASTPVDRFISKGVVRNVDETSKAINCIINSLEASLDNVEIKRAYISFAGLTVHSIPSKVTRGFEEHTKITPEIINDLAVENDETFQCPAGYTKVQVVNQEYRLDGKIDNNPIGAPTKLIEGYYLNIVIREQYLKQLNDSFAQAKIEIADSFSAARMDADILLSKDARRNGCALVNIGADTTTVSIYNNDVLRMLTVLPLGSHNITMDLCAGQISLDEAEEIKITRGYKSPGKEKEPIDTELVNSIINARMSEILQNVKYQVEESGELIGHIIFTGGGSKLKNIELLIEEFLPNFRTEVISEPQFSLVGSSGVNLHGIFTTALYGLLKQGKENCCEELVKEVPKTLFEQDIFSSGETEIKEETPDIIPEPENQELSKEEKRRIEKEEKEKKREEERLRKEEERRKKEEEKQRLKKLKEEQKKNSPGLWDTLFGKVNKVTKDFIGQVTDDEKDGDYDDEN